MGAQGSLYFGEIAEVVWINSSVIQCKATFSAVSLSGWIVSTFASGRQVGDLFFGKGKTA